MRYELKNRYLTVSVDTAGAELRSVSSARDGFEYMWQGDAEHWQGTAYHLFPFIGRLYKGRYRYDGKEYPMPLHGFAYTSGFFVKERTRSFIKLELSDNEKTYEIYPFRFSLSIEYELCGNTVSVRYSLKNKDFRTMYFGIGWHPGFNLPMDKDKSFEDYFVRFFSAENIENCGFSDSVLDTGERRIVRFDCDTLPLKHEDYSRDLRAFVNTGALAELSAQGGKRKIIISYKSIPYFGLWTSPEPAPFICAELMTMLPGRDGIVEETENKKDIIALSAGSTWHRTIALKFID